MFVSARLVLSITPYLGCCCVQQSYCKYTTGGLGAEITGFIQIASGNEQDLQTAVAYVGPIATAVDASSSAFRVSQDTHRHTPHKTTPTFHRVPCKLLQTKLPVQNFLCTVLVSHTHKSLGPPFEAKLCILHFFMHCPSLRQF